eukprot:2416674-Alexandrium_andersonii.AAC.1
MRRKARRHVLPDIQAHGWAHMHTITQHTSVQTHTSTLTHRHRGTKARRQTHEYTATTLGVMQGHRHMQAPCSQVGRSGLSPIDAPSCLCSSSIVL